MIPGACPPLWSNLVDPLADAGKVTEQVMDRHSVIRKGLRGKYTRRDGDFPREERPTRMWGVSLAMTGKGMFGFGFKARFV